MPVPRRIPVVDVFAGPGGLSEGFAAHAGAFKFDVVLSIEKDTWAHRTLELRSFFRQFPQKQAPEEYYQYVREPDQSKQELFSSHARQWNRAKEIARHAELGKEPFGSVSQWVGDALTGAKHWVLLGGPPCQAYSIIGRSRMKNMKDFDRDQRHTLYKEYLKIVAAHQPTIFVMENVPGILSSRHKDQRIFVRILNDLRDPWRALSEDDKVEIHDQGVAHRYHIYSFVNKVVWEEQLAHRDYVIECQDFLVPQARQRVILLGIRADYDVVPPVLEKAPHRITLESVINSLPPVRSRLSANDEGITSWVTAIRKSLRERPFRNKKYLEIRRRMKEIVRTLPGRLRDGCNFIGGCYPPAELKEWIFDSRLEGVLQHQSRAHMASDLCRYLFATVFTETHGYAPKLDQFPEELWPEHRNAVLDERTGKVENFRDRFRVQLWGEPATTITSHLRKDGHYYIHPDPIQCRSLTVREAARLQTFPDNYYFEGPTSRQFEQIGNAVPPLLAYQLADVVEEILDRCIDCDPETSAVANISYIEA